MEPRLLAAYKTMRFKAPLMQFIKFQQSTVELTNHQELGLPQCPLSCWLSDNLKGKEKEVRLMN